MLRESKLMFVCYGMSLKDALVMPENLRNWKKAWTATVDPTALGLNLLAFVHIQIDRTERNDAFLKAAVALPEVLECHHVTGEWNYLLKVRVHTTAELEDLITNKLKKLRGVARSSTVIVLTSPKETAVLPVG